MSWPISPARRRLVTTQVEAREGVSWPISRHARQLVITQVEAPEGRELADLPARSSVGYDSGGGS